MKEYPSALKEISSLCNIVFNQKYTKYSFFMPSAMRKYRFEMQSYNLRQVYKFIKGKIDSLEKSDGQNMHTENIHVPRMANVPAPLKKIEHLYNNSDLFVYILHGSYADNTCTAFSDIDDFIIINTKTFESFNNFKRAELILKKINNLYQTIDPTQHHGHWITTEYNLSAYNDSVMPVSVLKENAYSIGKSHEFTFNKIETKNEAKKIYDIILNELIQGKEDLFANHINLYSLKNLLSSIMLLLPLHFQMQGLCIHKKDAILLAKNKFPKEALELVTWATKIRDVWPSIQGYSHYPFLRFFNRICGNRNLTELLGAKFLPNIPLDTLPTITRNDFESFISHIKKIPQ